MMLAILSIFPIILWIFTVYSGRRDLTSCASIFFAVNMVSLNSGYFLYDPADAGASFLLLEPTNYYLDILQGGTLCIASFAFTAFGSTLLRNSIPADKAEKGNGLSELVVVSVAIVALTIYSIGVGPEALLNREVYMTETNKSAKSVGAVLCLAAVVLISIRLTDAAAPKTIHVILLLLIFALFASSSSRQLPLSSLLSGLVYCVWSRGRWRYPALLACIVAAPLLLHLVLHMRSQPHQGLVPTFEQLIDGNIFVTFDIVGLANNILLVNFPITAATATTAGINLDYLLTSINPLPGSWTNWYEITTGLNASTPYNTLGEWLSYSPIVAAVFFAWLGVLYSWVDNSIRAADRIAATAGYLMLNICTLSMLQYSTRTSLRLVYYYIAIRAVLFLYRRYAAPNNENDSHGSPASRLVRA